MVDLHTHSTVSDGTMSPSELINHANEKGLKAIALTDHDTVAGIKEAKKAAENTPLILISGVEISIDWKQGEFHLLGLGVDENSKVLNGLLENIRHERTVRNLKIIQKMQKAGFSINYSEIERNAGGVIGRPHIAAYMQKEKIVKTVQEAFDKYLAKGREFFIEKKSAPLIDAVNAIKSAKGIPVIAHPMSLYLSWSKLPDAVKGFKSLGIRGIEAWHPGTRYNNCKRLESLAEKLDLIVTAGSDFHGTVRKDRFLGFTCGGIAIDDKFYDNYIKAKNG